MWRLHTKRTNWSVFFLFLKTHKCVGPPEGFAQRLYKYSHIHLCITISQHRVRLTHDMDVVLVFIPVSKSQISFKYFCILAVLFTPASVAFLSSPGSLWLYGGQCLSVSPPLWSRLTYLNRHWMTLVTFSSSTIIRWNVLLVQYLPTLPCIYLQN